MTHTQIEKSLRREISMAPAQTLACNDDDAHNDADDDEAAATTMGDDDDGATHDSGTHVQSN